MEFRFIAMEGQTTPGGRKSMNKFVKIGRSSFSGTQVVQLACHDEKVRGVDFGQDRIVHSMRG